MKSELSPEASVYVPPPLRNVTNTKTSSPSTHTKTSSPSTPTKTSPASKEPQCSRYSRKCLRQVSSAPNSPRPILGTKATSPRPILGRKSEGAQDEAEEFIGKEFRSMTRSFARLKFKDENQPVCVKDEAKS
ncbi:hypothetical protein NQ317_011729 [Molorchus minor]|uniref:Uncharacterized protein n=1 Tax=Molorchus minor TaxID=1323400 RepID=A0ABQ9J9S8_9CUCU|nr:hypothetical protein NQ317_011729 [Molorchus minor]